MVVQLLLGLLATLVVVWVVLACVLYAASPDSATIRQAVRLIPDVVRLVNRLARDPSLSRSIRVRLWLLVGYLVLPIDLMPDFIPVLGYADDVIITALVLRSVVRRAGSDAVVRHWPGTDAGLLTLARVCRLELTVPDSGTI
ncbi:MAG: YkvA family protein [Acidimicrobiales bacterium]